MTNRTADEWLAQVFTVSGNAALSTVYDKWAESYDADMLSVGYLNPAAVAGLLCRHVPDRAGRVFDAGVGTGILGEILSILGYRNLCGVDMSDGMLARARRRNVYGDLRNRVLGEALDFEDGCVAAVVSTGVLTAGHAPPGALDELVRITQTGGHLIFTISTGSWQDGGFKEKVGALEAARRIRLVEATDAYRPMPLSPAEGEFTTRVFVYQRL